MPPDHHVRAVADGVHVHFAGIGQETVEQHRRILGDAHRHAHVTLQILARMDDLHGAAAEHIGGPHHQRIADFIRQLHGLVGGARSGIGRLQQFQLLHQFLEPFAVLGDVDGLGAGADDRRARCFQSLGELERRLAAVLHDHALGFFEVDDFKHVFERERLEVQPIGSVVVGGHRFRVAVDHDGLVAILAQRERGVHAAVIELDALTDAVRPATEHDDLFLLLGRGLALLLVGGVHVGRGRGKLGGATVDALVHRPHLERVPPAAHLLLAHRQQLGQATIGEALALPGAQVGGRRLLLRRWDRVLGRAIGCRVSVSPVV